MFCLLANLDGYHHRREKRFLGFIGRGLHKLGCSIFHCHKRVRKYISFLKFSLYLKKTNMNLSNIAQLPVSNNKKQNSPPNLSIHNFCHRKYQKTAKLNTCNTPFQTQFPRGRCVCVGGAGGVRDVSGFW